MKDRIRRIDVTDRFRRLSETRHGRRFVSNHAADVERSADIGAKTFGLAWLYVLSIYLVVLIGVWVFAIFVRRWWTLALAVLITLAVVPPMRREYRQRDQVRRALGRD